ncbi:MAG: outer membrane protein assembly factor BamA [Bacteroides sp.]|nr:outer membrane protein assembly factor BamA [Prevotella sp.]MCM1408157.1 outer membrane protein assembly factor BamA [Treponema brennaborense]MCM1469481.1 outer membrane protein assembly factor BamA [Bacteroides sp.]
MRIKKIFGVCFLCAAVSVFAQTSDTWYYGKILRDITFEGLENVKKTDVSAVTAKYIGKPFSDELYADLLTRLYALEYFEDDIVPVALPADAKRENVILKFTVKELPVVTGIKFSGNSLIRKAELEDAVHVKVRDIFNRAKAAADERNIRDLYLSKGFTNVKVSFSEERTEDGIKLNFVIDEGYSTVIKTIQFEGNQFVTDKTLKGEMELKEISLFNKGAFQEARLEMDKQAVLAYYQNRGYADAAILDVRRDVFRNEAKKREELTLTFVVREGVTYTYQGIAISGNTLFSTETLTNLIKLKPGSVYNHARVQEGLMAIADLYYENGYTSNQFIPQTVKDGKLHQIEYTLTIIEHSRSHVESIILRGNVKTKDYVILREMPVQSGDIFSKAKVTTGLRNLYNTQFFSTIVPDIQPGSENNLVNLILNLEEQSTTSIEFGVTFSGVQEPGSWPVSLFLKWQDSNIFGSGKTVAASITASKDTQAFDLSFSDSWLFGLPVSFSIAAGVEHTHSTALQKKYLPGGINVTDYYFDYEDWTNTLSVSLGRRWIPDFAILSWTGGIKFSLLRDIYDTDLYVPLDSTLSENSHAWGISNSVWTAFSVDNRDINYDPSKGWFASQRLTWTGLLPVESQYFLRSDTKLEGYLTLLDFPVTKTYNLKFVLSAYSGLSFLVPTPNTKLSSTNKLYIDGMFNGRGWTTIYKTKGQAMWSNIIELRCPVVKGVLSADFFFDAVALKSKAAEVWSSLTLNDFYFSFGPGFRFTIPQFPLRFLFANTFRIQDGEFLWQGKESGSGPEWQFVLSFNLTNK